MRKSLIQFPGFLLFNNPQQTSSNIR